MIGSLSPTMQAALGDLVCNGPLQSFAVGFVNPELMAARPFLLPRQRIHSRATIAALEARGWIARLIPRRGHLAVRLTDLGRERVARMLGAEADSAAEVAEAFA